MELKEGPKNDARQKNRPRFTPQDLLNEQPRLKRPARRWLLHGGRSPREGEIAHAVKRFQGLA